MDARQILGGQDALRGISIENARYHDSVFQEKQRRRATHIFGFPNIIDLKLHHAMNLIKMRLHVFPVSAKPRWKQESAKVAKIRVDGSRDAGILNLNGDLFA